MGGPELLRVVWMCGWAIEGYHAAMKHQCESCAFRRKAEANPGSLIARLWQWHTKWCPGWRAYQKRLATRDNGKVSGGGPA
jgi:hypothetical protein